MIKVINYIYIEEMIKQKFANLKKLMKELGEEKLDKQKIDSIYLISQNLNRSKNPTISNSITRQTIPTKIKKISLIDFQTPKNSKTVSKKMERMTQSTKIQSNFKSSDKKTISKKVNYKFLKEAVKNKMSKVARKLYDARNSDMQIKYSEIGWQQFLRTFLIKNGEQADLHPRKIDLSGLSLIQTSMLTATQIITSYESVNLSRNIIHTPHIIQIGSSKTIQQLILKNCNMKNEQLCKLFQLLLPTQIKIISLSSPDIKDRNNLTRYQELYQLIQHSQTLQSLQLSNIQIHPQNQIFASARKSKNLKKLDLSKNTGVAGICKTLTHLNLSYNSISKPICLRCLESFMVKLDLTGNPIRSHLFQEFLTITNFPFLQELILNKIVINEVGDWLKAFLQKTKSLNKLSLAQCQLSTVTYLNVIYGLQFNRTLKHLNLSNNKFPLKGVAQQFAIGLQKSNITHLYLQQCDIKDDCGAILFQGLINNQNIQYIDVSKNNLSQKTSQKICECLKKGCYNLLVLITNQNFIKYLQIKQIVAYISRNIFISKTRVREQYKKYKNVNTNTAQLLKSIEKAEHKISQLRSQISSLQQQNLLKQLSNDHLKADVLIQKLRLINQQQQVYEKNKNKIMDQLEHLNQEYQFKNPEVIQREIKYQSN